ncbi:MAG: Ankyrin repeat (many copies) [Rickettsiales bacterium]|jgi:hypothetical protein|nr:Ankyrin repeat (many copies) [Rickettsiales bacterium]
MSKDSLGQRLLSLIGQRDCNKEAVYDLLLAGANPNVIDEKGRTPLFWATGNNRFDLTYALLLYGAKTFETVNWYALKDHFNDTKNPKNLENAKRLTILLFAAGAVKESSVPSFIPKEMFVCARFLERDGEMFPIQDKDGQSFLIATDEEGKEKAELISIESLPIKKYYQLKGALNLEEETVREGDGFAARAARIKEKVREVYDALNSHKTSAVDIAPTVKVVPAIEKKKSFRKMESEEKSLSPKPSRRDIKQLDLSHVSRASEKQAPELKIASSVTKTPQLEVPKTRQRSFSGENKRQLFAKSSQRALLSPIKESPGNTPQKLDTAATNPVKVPEGTFLAVERSSSRERALSEGALPSKRMGDLLSKPSKRTLQMQRNGSKFTDVVLTDSENPSTEPLNLYI